MRRSPRLAQKRLLNEAGSTSSAQEVERLPPPTKKAKTSDNNEGKNNKRPMQASALCKQVQKCIQQHANASKAKGMKKYMRNQFEYLGLMSPTRKACIKEVLQEFPDPSSSYAQFVSVSKEVWNLPEREYQYVISSDLLPKVAKKLPLKSLEFCQELICDRSWWDTVDALACSVVGPVVLKHREAGVKVMRNWIKHENLWLRRAAILHQNSYKLETDQDLLFEFIVLTMHEKEEFFIQKAIGWALRNYARVKPDEVKGFVLQHKAKLSTLSFREATKHISV